LVNAAFIKSLAKTAGFSDARPSSLGILVKSVGNSWALCLARGEGRTLAEKQRRPRFTAAVEQGRIALEGLNDVSCGVAVFLCAALLWATVRDASSLLR
jgi:hypothetical protein